MMEFLSQLHIFKAFAKVFTKSISRLLVTVVVACALPMPHSKASEKRTPASALSKDTQEILSDAYILDAPETNTDKELSRLKKRPRAQVIKAVREGLRSDESAQRAALLAIRALALKEFLPELRNLAATSQDWTAIATINELPLTPAEANDVARIYLSRLANAPSEMSLVMLTGLVTLKHQIPRELFDKFMQGENVELQRSIAQNFLMAHHLYSQDDQTDRFHAIFRMKPYMSRLHAMVYFSGLSLKERKAMASAIPASLCESERHPQVKSACQSAREGLK